MILAFGPGLRLNSDINVRFGTGQAATGRVEVQLTRALESSREERLDPASMSIEANLAATLEPRQQMQERCG